MLFVFFGGRQVILPPETPPPLCRVGSGTVAKPEPGQSPLIPMLDGGTARLSPGGPEDINGVKHLTNGWWVVGGAQLGRVSVPSLLAASSVGMCF